MWKRDDDAHCGMQCTGGTMEMVIEEVLNRGGSESFTKVISIVAAPEALRRLSPNYPSTFLLIASLNPMSNPCLIPLRFDLNVVTKYCKTDPSQIQPTAFELHKSKLASA